MLVVQGTQGQFRKREQLSEFRTTASIHLAWPRDSCDSAPLKKKRERERDSVVSFVRIVMHCETEPVRSWLSYAYRFHLIGTNKIPTCDKQDPRDTRFFYT